MLLGGSIGPEESNAMARLKLSGGSINVKQSGGDETTLSAYTLSSGKVNAAPGGLAFNYQSQNDSPLIKLVKESTVGTSTAFAGGNSINPVNKSVMSQSTSQGNPLATTDSINLGGSAMPYEDDGGQAAAD
jgi:hypothetical protein